MKTNYAPSERLPKKDIDNQYITILNADFIQNIFDSLPYIASVINAQRQIIFSNTKLLSSLGIKSIENVLGARLGEVLNCVYSKNGEGGCGTSKECRYCGAVNAILKCQKEEKLVESECTIRSEDDGEMLIYEFGINVNPFTFDNVKYYIVSLFDNSDTKRKILLERMFFHDIMNKVGSLNGFLDLIKTVQDPEKINKYIHTVDTISQQLIKEIFSQKQIMEAENGTLNVNRELLFSNQFLEPLIQQILQHKVAKDRNVILDKNAENFDFFADSSLLGRVILNMLKNAAEASENGDAIKANCYKKENKIIFSVHNPTHMTEEVKAKIFKRSFSTKGAGRGLGTYSMKILTEKYLKGQIYFESEKNKGTTFFVELSSGKQ